MNLTLDPLTKLSHLSHIFTQTCSLTHQPSKTADKQIIYVGEIKLLGNSKVL